MGGSRRVIRPGAFFFLSGVTWSLVAVAREGLPVSPRVLEPPCGRGCFRAAWGPGMLQIPAQVSVYKRARLPLGWLATGYATHVTFGRNTRRCKPMGASCLGFNSHSLVSGRCCRRGPALSVSGMAEHPRALHRAQVKCYIGSSLGSDTRIVVVRHFVFFCLFAFASVSASTALLFA